MGVQGGRGACRQGRCIVTGNMQATHTNNIKRFHNIHYCFTCGYNADHPGNACPVAYPDYHMPNIPHDEAHMYANQGASMVVQHKSLPDGTGAGMVWILVDSIIKAQFVMQCQQDFAKQPQHQQLYYPQ